jgi:methionine synthase II (cobalamin-independent)
MTIATGIGSLPGDDAAAFDEAVRAVLGELPDLPHLPELPGRGATASMTGRTLALVGGLDADLQPAGWRLTGSTGFPGVDHRRARSLLAQDLDAFEEQAQGYEGRFKVQVTGPWTLAATVEKPRGDRVLADHGARRELAQALAEGVAEHVADVRRRVPGATELLVQVDEPALPAVLAGSIPTASGFHRHRSVDLPVASALLEEVFAAVASAGAVPLAHCCAADVPAALLTGAGAQGLSVDLGVLAASAYDEVATLLEKGAPVLLGVVPSTDPATPPGEKAEVERVLRFLDMLGFDPEAVAGHLVVTPSCGLAGATPAWAREALRLTRSVATSLG